MSELRHLLERLSYFCIKWEFTDFELSKLIGIGKNTVKRLKENMYRLKRKQRCLLVVKDPTIKKLKKFIEGEELHEKQTTKDKDNETT